MSNYKSEDQINKEFDEKFFQDRTGEKCEGWLAMRTDILTKGDYKIAIPNDLKSFIHQIRKEDRESLREKLKKMIKQKDSPSVYATPDDGYDLAIDEVIYLLDTLE